MDILKQIQKYTQETLGALLFEKVPEYRIIFDSDPYKHEVEIGNYSFMNNYSTILVEKIKKEASSSFVIKSFDYINQIGESNNLEVLNILKVGILEILYTSGSSVREKANRLLNEKLKKMFEEFSKTYH